MGENYVEQLVKQNMTGKTMAKIAGLAGLVLLSFVVTLLVPMLTILPIIAIIVVFYLGKRWSCVEFEYIYFNGEVDIDRILGMEKRKRYISFNAKEMEILASTGSSALKAFENLPLYDCSTNTDAHSYEVVTTYKEKKVRIRFEPNQEILDGLRLYAPRKVML